MAKYKRILLKLSGESLMGENNTALTKKTGGICRTNQRNP